MKLHDKMVLALDKYYDSIKRGTASGVGRPNYKEYSTQELSKCIALFRLTIE